MRQVDHGNRFREGREKKQGMKARICKKAQGKQSAGMNIPPRHQPYKNGRSCHFNPKGDVMKRINKLKGRSSS